MPAFAAVHTLLFNFDVSPSKKKVQALVLHTKWADHFFHSRCFWLCGIYHGFATLFFLSLLVQWLSSCLESYRCDGLIEPICWAECMWVLRKVTLLMPIERAFKVANWRSFLQYQSKSMESMAKMTRKWDNVKRHTILVESKTNFTFDSNQSRQGCHRSLLPQLQFLSIRISRKLRIVLGMLNLLQMVLLKSLSCACISYLWWCKCRCFFSFLFIFALSFSRSLSAGLLLFCLFHFTRLPPNVYKTHILMVFFWYLLWFTSFIASILLRLMIQGVVFVVVVIGTCCKRNGTFLCLLYKMAMDKHTNNHRWLIHSAHDDRAYAAKHCEKAIKHTHTHAHNLT